MKFGEYLIGKEIISKENLKEALSMQVDNPKLKLGEIIVSLDFLAPQDLKEHIHSYTSSVAIDSLEFTDWLNQSEIDDLVGKLKNQL